MKILGVSLVVASLLVLAACGGDQESATGGGAAPANAASLAPAPADGTTIMLDVRGMT